MSRKYRHLMLVLCKRIGCIFKIEFKPDGDHLITVNQNPEQYSCTDVAEKSKDLNNLLNCWTQSCYRYHVAFFEYLCYNH